MLSMLMRLLFRTALVLAASVFIASLLAAAAVLALVYMLWCVLRGHKPQWPTVFMGPLQHLRRRPHQNRERQRPQPSRPTWPGDMAHGLRPSGHSAGVVEGQAREVR
jgi:hypothetical protein